MKTKRKKVSYKGIPAKARGPIAKYRKLTATLTRTGFEMKSPQEILQEVRDEKAKEGRQKADDAKKRAKKAREHALSALQRCMLGLSDASDAVGAIEDGEETYFDNSALAGFARRTIHEIGANLEQALCDLGLIPEDDSPCFVAGGLKRAKALQKATEQQEVAHGS